MPIYEVVYTYADSQSREGSKRYETQNLADNAAGLAAAASLADDLAALTGADILRYRLTQTVLYTDTVTAGANKDEGITLSVRKTDTMRDTLKVPAPIDSIYDGAGNVDVSLAVVTNYVDHFTAGGEFTFSDGELVIDLLSGTLDV